MFSRITVARTDVNLTRYNYGCKPVSVSRLGKLDVVFALYCTGSMCRTIKECQKNIADIVNHLTNSDGQDVRFALIPYRDHNLGMEYCSKVYPFTRDVGQMQRNVNAQSAKTGGKHDGPEAVTAALFEALCIEWREDAAKLVVIMADAPPHGIRVSGRENYPKEDPDGKDPLTIAREMESLGIAVYGIVVGSGLHDEVTTQFFASVSDITGGQCLGISNANLLADGILEGARENIDLERHIIGLQQHIAEIEAKKKKKMTKAARAKATKAFLSSSSGCVKWLLLELCPQTKC